MPSSVFLHFFFFTRMFFFVCSAVVVASQEAKLRLLLTERLVSTAHTEQELDTIGFKVHSIVISSVRCERPMTVGQQHFLLLRQSTVMRLSIKGPLSFTCASSAQLKCG